MTRDICELCGVRCSSNRYLCIYCAKELNIQGTYRERQEKREESSRSESRGVA